MLRKAMPRPSPQRCGAWHAAGAHGCRLHREATTPQTMEARQHQHSNWRDNCWLCGDLRSSRAKQARHGQGCNQWQPAAAQHARLPCWRSARSRVPARPAAHESQASEARAQASALRRVARRGGRAQRAACQACWAGTQHEVTHHYCQIAGAGRPRSAVCGTASPAHATHAVVAR